MGARRAEVLAAPATSASPCSSPTSPATSARTPAPAASTCRVDWLREAGIDPRCMAGPAGFQRGPRPPCRAAAARRPMPSTGAPTAASRDCPLVPARHVCGALAVCGHRPRLARRGHDAVTARAVVPGPQVALCCWRCARRWRLGAGAGSAGLAQPRFLLDAVRGRPRRRCLSTSSAGPLARQSAIGNGCWTCLTAGAA